CSGGQPHHGRGTGMTTGSLTSACDSNMLQREARLQPTDSDALIIGLVNNMPDAELENTEIQFRELLHAASSGLPIRLKLFAVPEVRRSDAGRAQIRERYSDI